MTVLEIALLVIGALIFFASFLIPVGRKETSEDIGEMISGEVKKKVDEEINGIRSHVEDVVDEAVEYASEKTERSLERISNEKIMAVNEYSDTVLEQINKNHQEVMFLYDMLNDKHENLISSVSEATQAAKEANQATEQVNKAVRAAKESTKEAMEASQSFKSLTPEEAESGDKVIKTAEPYQGNPYGITENDNIFSVSGQLSDLEETAEIKADNTDINEKPKVRTLRWAAMAEEDAEGINERENPAKAATFEKAIAPEKNDPQMPQFHIPEGNWSDRFGSEARSKVAARKAPDDTSDIAQLQEKVLRLYDLGKTKTEIARELNMGVGEVSLIIDLHKE